jgi:hypothetical protein
MDRLLTQDIVRDFLAAVHKIFLFSDVRDPNLVRDTWTRVESASCQIADLSATSAYAPRYATFFPISSNSVRH